MGEVLTLNGGPFNAGPLHALCGGLADSVDSVETTLSLSGRALELEGRREEIGWAAIRVAVWRHETPRWRVLARHRLTRSLRAHLRALHAVELERAVVGGRLVAHAREVLAG